MRRLRNKYLRALVWLLGISLLFMVYIDGLGHNPPGFYIDESAPCYNAYLIARTGVGESGERFPLFLKNYPGMAVQQYSSPVQLYLLVLFFLLVPPSILAARVFSAFWVFLACLLLGFLAKRISGRVEIGIIVAIMALLTPWFFEGRGLLLEPQFMPMALAPLLLAIYYTQERGAWKWSDVLLITGGLALVTYSYTSGRILGPLLAFGLVLFATAKRSMLGIVKTWACYGVTLVPIFVFNWRHPGALTKRLAEVSYIDFAVPWKKLAYQFTQRFLEDQSLAPLLLHGDLLGRHHVPGAGGAIFLPTFLLALFGLFLIFAGRWREPWWRFIVYGLAISIIPGAVTTWPFHQMRLMAYPVFLLILTVPALEWLLVRDTIEKRAKDVENGGQTSPQAIRLIPSYVTRLGIFGLLFVVMLFQATRFQKVFRTEGPRREWEFDASYKDVYKVAVERSTRPIYLEDGTWGPGYIHALWHATIEGRPKSEFVHLAEGTKPPPGALVLSSQESCDSCEIITKKGFYMVYLKQ